MFQNMTSPGTHSQADNSNPARSIVDAFYEAREKSPTLKRALYEAAGADALPQEFPVFNFATRSELDRVAALLELDSSKLLIELPCKDGSAGLYLTSITHCQLLGLDTSPTAITIATSRAKALGLAAAARHQVVGNLSDTGVTAGAADAVLSCDELWLAADQAAVLREMCRVLKPGGILALSSWEHTQPAAFVKDPVADYAALLHQVGLGEVLLYERQPHELRRAVGRKVLEQQEQIEEEMGDMAKYILGEVKMVAGLVDGVDYCDGSRGSRVLLLARKPAGA